ncbi:MAG: hypothetical protein ACKORJ_08325, partial [Bacteroidota bacterium]
MSENLGHLAGRGGLKNNLFERLGTSAEASGTPDPAVLDQLRREFLTGTGTLTGTVSFYDFLRPENRHKKVYVCNGSACLTAGTQGNLREQLEQEFGKDAVGEMCCLGRCHENNAFHLNGSNYSGTSVDQLTAITTDHKRLPDTYHIGHHGTPLLTGFANDEARTISIIRKTLGITPQQLIDALSIAGLRGRGGAELLHKARTSGYKIDRNLMEDLLETLESLGRSSSTGAVVDTLVHRVGRLAARPWL